ncbi:hypothetical protein EMCRGX_G015075 [Ephydatia muelleri]
MKDQLMEADSSQEGRSTSCPVLDAFFSCMRECKDTQESPEFDYVRYILLAAPYRQEFIFSAYSVPCTSPQCLVWFKLWSSMAKQPACLPVSGCKSTSTMPPTSYTDWISRLALSIEYRVTKMSTL